MLHMTKKEIETRHDILKERGKRIRQRREQMKLTQEQLGELCGWNQKRISFYEGGDREADAESLVILAKILQVSPAFFYPGEENKNNVYNFPFKTSIVAAAKKLPLLTPQEALHFRSKEYMEKISSDPHRKFITVTNDTSDNCALMLIIDDSMANPDKASQRTFAPNDIAMVDPDLKPEIPDMVLAGVANSDRAILRQYWFNPATNKHQLTPFNIYYPVIDIDESVTVLGVITQKITRFRP